MMNTTQYETADCPDPACKDSFKATLICIGNSCQFHAPREEFCDLGAPECSVDAQRYNWVCVTCGYQEVGV